MKIKRITALLMATVLFMGILVFDGGHVISASSVTRDTVLVIDSSGSMSGSPMTTLKQSAIKFCTSVLAGEGVNRVALVVYSSTAYIGADFTDDTVTLETAINSLYASGGTGMLAAVEEADLLLKSSLATVRNLVIMTDGIPNTGGYSYTGKYTSADYYDFEYANAVYETVISYHSAYSVYTLGFFHNLSSRDLAFASQFLRDLQNEGYYEVTDVNDLEFTFGEIASDIVEKKITGQFNYSSSSNQDYTATYYYDDNYFAQRADIYNPSLATMTLCFAMSCFGSNETNSYKFKTVNAENLLEELGYSQFETNQSYREKPEADTIGVLAANKKITANGKVYTIIAVGVRGGGYEREWASNFTLGKSGFHSGFDTAKKNVLKFLKDYISGNDISGDIKIWITGYSRAAATVNLVAGALNEGESLGNKATLQYDDLYAYCFACPMGVLRTDIKKTFNYGNIWNIISPHDPVPKVAPAAMGFSRYGENEYLPTAATTSGYSSMKKTMLKQLELIDSVDKYIVEDFRMKKISWWHILPGGNPAIINDEANKKNQNIFLDDAILRLSSDFIKSRTNYYNTFETGIRELLKAVCQDESKVGKIIDLFFIKFSEYMVQNQVIFFLSPAIGSLRFLAIHDDISNSLIKSFDEAGVTGYDKNSIKKAAKPLIDTLVALAISDPDFTVSIIENNKSVIQAHFSEIYLAWLQSMDVNYTTSAGQSFGSGSYRIIRINCPVDIEVFDMSGSLVASILSGEPQEIDDSAIISSVNEDGERLVYLPADAEYDVKIEATDVGEVTYAVNEHSPLVGGVNRLVNYYNIPVSNRDVLKGRVPSFSNTDLQNGSPNGTKTAYTLTDPKGNDLIPDLDISGDDALSAYYTVKAESEDITKGVVFGAGSRQVGNFILVEAIAQEGYVFDAWYRENQPVSSEAAYRFCVLEDVELIARFKETTGVKHTLTLSASKGGRIESGNEGDFAAGSALQLKASADKGYSFKGWSSSNGGAFSDEKKETTVFIMPDNSTIVTAEFARTSAVPGWAVIILVILLIVLGVVVVLIIVFSTSNKQKTDSEEDEMNKNKDIPLLSQQDYAGAKKGCIKIITGSMQGLRFPIREGETINIGKNPKLAHIVISEEYSKVSQLHCTVSFSASSQKYFVTDCSMNGTYMSNGTRLEKAKRTPVLQRTILFLGNESCSIELQ